MESETLSHSMLSQLIGGPHTGLSQVDGDKYLSIRRHLLEQKAKIGALTRQEWRHPSGLTYTQFRAYLVAHRDKLPAADVLAAILTGSGHADVQVNAFNGGNSLAASEAPPSSLEDPAIETLANKSRATGAAVRGAASVASAAAVGDSDVGVQGEAAVAAALPPGTEPQAGNAASESVSAPSLHASDIAACNAAATPADAHDSSLQASADDDSSGDLFGGMHLATSADSLASSGSTSQVASPREGEKDGEQAAVLAATTALSQDQPALAITATGGDQPAELTHSDEGQSPLQPGGVTAAAALASVATEPAGAVGGGGGSVPSGKTEPSSAPAPSPTSTPAPSLASTPAPLPAGFSSSIASSLPHASSRVSVPRRSSSSLALPTGGQAVTSAVARSSSDVGRSSTPSAGAAEGGSSGGGRDGGSGSSAVTSASGASKRGGASSSGASPPLKKGVGGKKGAGSPLGGKPTPPAATANRNTGRAATTAAAVAAKPRLQKLESTKSDSSQGEGTPRSPPVFMRAVFDDLTSPVTKVLFANTLPDLLAYAAEDGAFRICNVAAPGGSGVLAEPRVKHELQGHMKEVTDFDWSTDDSFLCSSSNDKSVRVWEVDSGRCLRIIYSAIPQLAICFHPANNNFLLVANAKKELTVMNFSTGRAVSKHVMDKAICGVEAAPNNVVFVGDYDGVIHSFTADPLSGALHHRHRCTAGVIHPAPMASLHFRPSSVLAHGAVLLTASLDGTVRFYTVALELEGYLFHKLTLQLSSTASNLRAAFSPQLFPSSDSPRVGEYIVTGNADHHVYFYDFMRPKNPLVARVSGHKSMVVDVAWNCDGSVLASCDQSGVVAVWGKS